MLERQCKDYGADGKSCLYSKQIKIIQKFSECGQRGKQEMLTSVFLL